MIKEAIILAGGLGTRLKSVVNDVPKPMAPINGRPFLQKILEQLSEIQVEKVVLSVGYKHEVIQQYFGHKYRNISIEYAVEETALGTGGGIRLAMSKCTSTNVLVLNGDTYFDVDLSRFSKFHEEASFDVSLCLRSVPDAGRYGKVVIKGQAIVDFMEKSLSNDPGLINGGTYLINKQIFLTNSSEGNFSFETDFLQTLCNSLAFGGYESDGYFIDIGIPEDFQKANGFFK